MKKIPTSPPVEIQPIESLYKAVDFSPYEAIYWDHGMWEQGILDGKSSMADVEIGDEEDKLSMNVLWEPVEKGYHRSIKVKLDAQAARNIAYTLLMYANNLDD